MHLLWKKRTALLLFLLLVLSGCSAYDLDPIQDNFIRGKHAAVIDEYQANQPKIEPFFNAYRIILCESLYAVRDYSNLQKCADEYIQLMGGRWEQSMHAMAFALKALAYLDVGEYDSALMYAEETLKLESNQGYYVQYHQWGMSQFRPFLNAYFVKAMVTFHKDPTAKREIDQLLKQIDALEKDDDSITSDMKFFKKERNFALAKIYLAQSRYQDAYDMIRSYDEQGRFTQMAKFFDPFSALTDYLFEFGDYGNESEVILLPRMYMLAKSALETDRHAEARETYETILTSDALPGMSNLHYLVLYDLSTLLRLSGDFDQAAGHLRQAIEIIEKQRSSIATERSRIGFVGDKSKVYNELVDLLFDQGKFSEALQYAERGKARALIDMLATKQQLGPGEAKSQVAGLLRELQQTEVASQSIRPTSTGVRAINSRAMKRVRSEIKDFNPEVSSLVGVDVPDIKSLQQELAIDEILIEYFGDEESMVVFVVDRHNIRGIRIDSRDIDDLVRNYREALQNPLGDDYLALGEQLYRRLVNPIRKFLLQPKLTFVPHGSLHYLPFGSLNSNGRYLVQDFQLRVLPSASVAQYLTKGSLDSSAKAGILGNPDLGDASYDLPFAEKEAKAIGNILPDSQVLVRKRATETAVKQMSGKVDILHIASHGIFDQANPLNSGLLLHGDAANDGILSVEELYETELSVNLVTLSACETALGETGNGDDVLGFTRGLLFAGANSIVSSLWQVDDQSTSTLMQAFYDRLFELGPSGALRHAQMKMIDSHPFYWAAFQVTGAAGWQ
ncbi:CHAT domain-containing protein [Gammaproteobacteria bacterium]|nr:CHAT domain-containing protein [Gammaproteobacteria bacterium]